MMPRLNETINQCYHFSSQYVVDFQDNMCTNWQIVADDRGWIEGIRVVLKEACFCWQLILLCKPRDKTAIKLVNICL